MATPKAGPEGKALEVKAPGLKRYKVLTNVLGEPNPNAGQRRLHSHVHYPKGSVIELSDKDAIALLKLKSIAPLA